MQRVPAHRHRRAPLLAPLLLAALACERTPPPPPVDAIAAVGDRLYTWSEFEGHVRASVGEAGESLASPVLSRLLDQFLEEEMLRRLAAERRLVDAESPGDVAAAALVRAAPPPPPGDAEIAAWYTAHATELARPERVRLRQVLTADRPTAERARAALAAGEDFAAVARRLSIDPSAERGGDQGELGREDLPPAFADIIFGLEVGGTSDIVAADYGFHLFQVTARLPAATPTLAEATPGIRSRLEAAAAEAALRRVVEEARRHYNVAVYARNLPFRYSGVFGS